MRLFHFLVLMRPANIVTAVADILAGVAIAGVFVDFSNLPFLTIVFLCLSTIGLYGGGVVFNDVFDFEIDKVERPERPISSGIVSRREASILGSALLLFGVSFASFVNITCLIISILISISALVYDKYAKHNIVFGPLTMGVCRGLNLLLGMSILSKSTLPELWMIAGIPLLFIAAITLTSQGEVLGNNRLSIILALTLDIIITGIIALLAIKGLMNLMVVIPFLLLWFGMNFLAKQKAIAINEPRFIMKAVKIGVLSLIPLNATYVAGFSDWKLGLAVLILLPISMLMARKFAVT